MKVSGEFAYYGTDGVADVVAPAPGKEVVLDADTVFHAVLPVGVETDLPPSLQPGLHAPPPTGQQTVAPLQS
jgi:hypothetical protein